MTEEEQQNQQQINSAIVQNGLRFGVTWALTEALVLAVFAMFQVNPYAPQPLVGLVLLPIFAGLGLRYLRKFSLTRELSFGQTFRVGSMISFIGAFCSALLIYIFTTLTNSEVLNEYLAQVQQYITEHQSQINRLVGPGSVKRVTNQLAKITPASLAYEDFVRKMMMGMLTSLIMAFFFRK